MSGGVAVELRLQRRELLLEDVLEAPERDDARAALARERACRPSPSRFVGELLAERRAPRGTRCVRSSAAGELLLVAEVRRLERDGLLEGRERVGGHVVLEVHVAERGERLARAADVVEDALPRLHRERRVAVLEVAIAEVDEVPGIAAADRCARR